MGVFAYPPDEFFKFNSTELQTEEEHLHIQKGLRSSNAFVLRRSQILLASSRGE
jgi:hypothetical protein